MMMLETKRTLSRDRICASLPVSARGCRRDIFNDTIRLLTSAATVHKLAILLACATLGSVRHADALNVFPVATNSTLAEFGSGMAFDGTNYFVMMVSGTNLVGQLVSTNGASIGSQINIGS